MPTTSVFALTRANGGSTVGALLAPSDLLISASSSQSGPSDLPGSSFTTSVAQIGQQLTLADGNTGTVVDVSSDQSATGNYALLHLASPESATPLALSSAPVSNGQPTLVSNGTSSYTTTISNRYGNLSANAPDGTGPDYQGIFLSPDGGTLLGLGTNDEDDRSGHTISGPAISSNATALTAIQQWLAADAATQSATAGNNNPPTGGSPSDYHTPASSAAAAFTETVNGAPGSQQGILYSGPVADLYYQLVVLTPGNINVTTHSPGCFVSTGAGNDAIALNSGTNVVDAGGGSNFLTSGSGFDTFFLDARNIPAASSAAGPVPGAIWDTVQGFGHGDAVTLWGIGPGTALAWQKNEGAVGHTGLTLHAITPNGATTSLTLAGIDDKSHLALSYGQSGGANYLYVKAV